MQQEKLNEYKIKLTEEKALIETELKGVGVLQTESKDWIATRADIDAEHSDKIDTADNMEEYSTRDAITEELEVRLNNILSALKRIDENVYGVCTTCQNPIEEDRLNANTSAATCKEHIND